MKKSGTRPRWAGGGLAARSADALIAPERDEITPQVLAESLDLGLEAAAQEGHELLVGRRRRAIHQALLQRIEDGLAKAVGRERLARRLQHPRQRASPPSKRAPQRIEPHRAHADRRVGLAGGRWRGVVHVEEA